MEESGKMLKETTLEVIDTQLRDRTPPETRETYERLMAEGHSDQEARELIAAVLIGEIFDMLQQKNRTTASDMTPRSTDFPGCCGSNLAIRD